MRELCYAGIGALFSRMGLSGVKKFGKILGTLFWYFLPGRRNLAIRTIEERLEVPRDEAVHIARKNFAQTAQAFGEIFLIRQVDHRFIQEHVYFPDQDLFDQTFQSHRPVVVVTAHLGSWEFFAGICGPLLPDRPTQGVVRLPKDKAMGNLMMHLRGVGKVEIVTHRNAAKKVLRCLRKGGMSAFLVDHNCSRSEAIFLPFLGKIAAVNMGPALLALRSQALVLPVFLLRNGESNYMLRLSTPLDTVTLTGTREEKIRAIAGFYTGEVETMVRNYPEQWFWMHKRWKTRPDNEVD
ncbi:MAG: acyltransferase [Desulfoplanes sp.]|nr:acyltransferase [Desulfoplanes sp.]MDD4650186.1 acyltransferase [Desulfoplanes sp.]